MTLAQKIESSLGADLPPELDFAEWREVLAALRTAGEYSELIMAVGHKFPGETRHQTALRYILRPETSNVGVALRAKGEGNETA